MEMINLLPFTSKKYRHHSQARDMFWHTVIGVSLLKLLAIPSWYGGDLHVHMKWMARTHLLPCSLWYSDVDGFPYLINYGTLFAWLEYVMGWFAKFVDPKMLAPGMEENNSFAAIAFQRVSVVVTDLSMAFGISVCATAFRWEHQRKWLMAVITFTNAGLFFVDHIHFHYTGLLQGLFLASIG